MISKSTELRAKNEAPNKPLRHKLLAFLIALIILAFISSSLWSRWGTMRNAERKYPAQTSTVDVNPVSVVSSSSDGAGLQ